MENFNIENDAIDMEKSNLKVEKLRYQTNGLSYRLGLLAILLSILGAFVLMNSLNPKGLGFLTIFKVLMNVCILLFGFMACEKVKYYSKSYSMVMFVLAGVTIVRMFAFPMVLMTNYLTYKDALGDTTKIETMNKARGYLSDAVVTKGSNYLPNSGVFRAILAMILLACAATAFITSGIICLRKNRLLMAYLKSINQDM